MTGPASKLAHDAQRLAAAERLRRIPGEPLVGDIGVVFESAGRIDDVDPPAALTRSELGAPNRGVECRGEVDVVLTRPSSKFDSRPGTSISPTARSAFVPCRYTPAW